MHPFETGVSKSGPKLQSTVVLHQRSERHPSLGITVAAGDWTCMSGMGGIVLRTLYLLCSLNCTGQEMGF
jgi:hypothetical protein